MNCNIAYIFLQPYEIYQNRLLKNNIQCFTIVPNLTDASKYINQFRIFEKTLCQQANDTQTTFKINKICNDGV